MKLKADISLATVAVAVLGHSIGSRSRWSVSKSTRKHAPPRGA